MTDNLRAHTYALPQPVFVAPSTPSPAQVFNNPPETPGPDDEPYTIKCICNFEDDDGATVYCEKCDTWQHIQCYYPKSTVPDVHNCVDCEPRSLDPKEAVERQRRRREQDVAGDRKTKRAPAKSHKRKPRESLPEISTTAVSTTIRSTWVPPPAKRPRINHRATNSVISQSDKKVNGQRKALGSNQARASSSESTPELCSPSGVGHVHTFSPEFMRLQDEDPGDSNLQTNLFSNIAITGVLANWIHDTDALRAATNGRAPGEVFQRVDGNFESLQLPEVMKRTSQDQSVEFHGRHPKWDSLIVQSSVPCGGLVGEIKGQVGHLHDYRLDPANRWSYLRHPEPFVFFHPQLPIYIDTRREGTRCRYIRRACRPNVKMTTLISNGTEYHFCLCATEDIEAGTEVTLGWEVDVEIHGLLARRMAELNPSQAKMDPLSPAENERVAEWAGRILANHGGCACNDPQHCALARWKQKELSAALPVDHRWPDVIKRRKSRATKKPGSPAGTDNAQNSRAGSEAIATGRDCKLENDESRSTSGSFPSKPHSRDITPLTHFSGDAPLPLPVPELSDREKRKLAAVERTFEQLEQGNQQPSHRKKKRNTSGSVAEVPSGDISVTPQSPSPSASTGVVEQARSDPAENGMPEKHIVGPNRKHRRSSPKEYKKGSLSVSKTRTSAANKTTPAYTHASVQTDPTDDVWFDQPVLPFMRKRASSLTKQLLMRCHQHGVRSRQFQERKIDPAHQHIPLPTEMDVDMVTLPDGDGRQSPLALTSSVASLRDNVESANVSVVHEVDPRVQKPRPPDPPLADVDHEMNGVEASPLKPPLEVLNRQGESTSSTALDHEPASTTHRTPDLRLQLPPTSVGNSIPPSTPSSAAGSMAQSPLGMGSHPPIFSPTVISSVVQPSFVKKKLSLSDYVSRKYKTETPSVEKAPPLESLVQSPVPENHSSSSPMELTHQRAVSHEMRSDNETKQKSGLVQDSAAMTELGTR